LLQVKFSRLSYAKFKKSFLLWNFWWISVHVLMNWVLLRIYFDNFYWNKMCSRRIYFDNFYWNKMCSSAGKSFWNRSNFKTPYDIQFSHESRICTSGCKFLVDFLWQSGGFQGCFEVLDLEPMTHQNLSIKKWSFLGELYFTFYLSNFVEPGHLPYHKNQGFFSDCLLGDLESGWSSWLLAGFSIPSRRPGFNFRPG